MQGRTNWGWVWLGVLFALGCSDSKSSTPVGHDTGNENAGAGGDAQVPLAASEGGGGASEGGSETRDDENVAGGGSGSDVAEPTPTLRIPETPFLIRGFDAQVASEVTHHGPWAMALRTGTRGALDGVIVSLDPTQDPSELPLASKVRLEPKGGGYRIAEETVLERYEFPYDFTDTPTLCFDQRSLFAFRDDDGDRVADSATISGEVATLAFVGSNWAAGEHCGANGYSSDLDTTARVNPFPPTMSSHGGALNPVLLLEGGFLKAGTGFAWVNGLRRPAAEPLSLNDFIYGFALDETLEPEAPLRWTIQDAESFGAPLDATELVAPPLDNWAELSDGSFETSVAADGLAGVRAVTKLEYGQESIELPAIHGTKSLLFESGAQARFRLKRPSGGTVLRFIVKGDLHVDVGVVGGAAADPDLKPARENVDCKQANDYAAFCAAAATADVPPVLGVMSVPLPAGKTDVLVRLRNDSGYYYYDEVLLDDVRIE